MAMPGQTCSHCGVRWTHTTFEPIGSTPSYTPPVSSASSGSSAPAQNFKVGDTNVAVRGMGVLLGVLCAVGSFGLLAVLAVVVLVMWMRPKPAPVGMPPVPPNRFAGPRFGSKA